MAESYGLLRPRNTNGVLPVEQEFRRSQQRKNRQGMTHYDTPEEGETIQSVLSMLNDMGENAIKNAMPSYSGVMNQDPDIANQAIAQATQKVTPLAVDVLGGGFGSSLLAGPKLGNSAVFGANMPTSASRTDTGWTFKDVKGVNSLLSKAENRMANMETAAPKQAILPIRSLNATQRNVNADFADPVPRSSGMLPVVLKKDGEFFVRDGHHRITKVAEEGGQNARVNLIDLDKTDTSAPLLDWKPKQKPDRSDKDLLEKLYAELSEDGTILGANRSKSAGVLAATMQKKTPAELRRQANIQRFGYDPSDPVATKNAELTNNAKQFFGVTRRAEETGYMLPDGTRLDLSGRHAAGGYTKKGDSFVADTGKPDYLAGGRATDHRELYDLEGIKDSEHQWGAVEQLMTDTGAIRYMPGQGISIIKGQKVSDKQLNKIVSDFRKSGDPLNVDIDPIGGWSKAESKYFEKPTVEAVKKFIESIK